MLKSLDQTMTFREFLLKSVQYKPDAKIPTTTFRLSGPEKMNPLQSVPPSKSYMPIFRMGNNRGKQAKTTVANRKH